MFNIPFNPGRPALGYGITNQVLYLAGFHYTKEAGTCAELVRCINGYPVYYADTYPRLPACEQFVADAATYGELAGEM